VGSQERQTHYKKSYIQWRIFRDKIKKTSCPDYLGRKRYLSVRPAFDADHAAYFLEGCGADPELLARVHHREVKITRDITQLQLAYSLPLQNEIGIIPLIKIN
jgi:hypothetical protein